MNTQQKIKGIEYYKKTLHLCSVFCYDFTTIINFSTGDGTSETHHNNSPLGGIRPQDGREVNTTQLCNAEHTIVCVTIQVNQDVRHSRIPICIQRSAESLRNLDAHARYHSLSMTQFGGLFPAWGGVVRSAGECWYKMSNTKINTTKNVTKFVTFFVDI